MRDKEFGIYLNTRQLKAVRVNSPYWIPSGEDWVFLTPQVNEGLLKIRELAKQKKLVDSAEKIVWGSVAEFTD